MRDSDISILMQRNRGFDGGLVVMVVTVVMVMAVAARARMAFE